MDDDDLSSQDGIGSESSSSELPSPISWDDHRHHLEIETEKKVKSSIEVMKIIEKTEIAGNGKDRGAGEIMEHSVPENGKDGGAGEIMEHSVPENGKDGGAGEIKEHSIPENGKDGGAGEIKEHSVPENGKDGGAGEIMEHSVPENGKDGGAGEIKEHSIPENGKDGGAGEIKEHSVPENGKDEIKVDEALPPSSSPVPNSPKSVAIPISNLESSKLEHELEKIECSVPLSEHASQADLETIEIVTEAKRGEGMPVSSLSDESARKIEVWFKNFSLHFAMY